MYIAAASHVDGGRDPRIWRLRGSCIFREPAHTVGDRRRTAEFSALPSAAREAIPSAPEIAAKLGIAVHARLPLPSADAAQNRRMEGERPRRAYNRIT